IRFELCVQRYVDERSTPIEDTAVEWPEQVSPPERVAILTIPQADVTNENAVTRARSIDAIAFNPWNTTDSFRPLGNLNRARKAVYDAASAHRKGYRFQTVEPARNIVLGAVATQLFKTVNRFVEWHRLPTRLGVLNLDMLRRELRRHNLIDTDPHEAPPLARPVPPAEPTEETLVTRNLDGTGNDLSA